MVFLAPLFWYAALGVAAGVVALHALATRRPRATVLPTARFAPERAVPAAAAARRLHDLAVLAVRIACVLAAGAALARPIIVVSARRPVVRIVAVDRAGPEERWPAARDSARALFRPGDVLIEADSAVKLGVLGDLDRTTRSGSARAGQHRGLLSAVLVTALRAASQVGYRADSIELVIISPFLDRERDAATASLRARWPGRIHLVRVPVTIDRGIAAPTIDVRAAPDDPLRAALRDRAASGRNGLRLVRDTLTTADLAWAAATGHVLVSWPRTGRPMRTRSRDRPDTVGAVVAGSDALVLAPFARRWEFAADSLVGAVVLARWVDGQPVAAQWAASTVPGAPGSGCVRSIAIDVPRAGDLVLRPEFARLVDVLTAPCGGLVGAPLSLAALDTLAGTDRLARGSTFPRPADAASPLAPWLFAAAAAFLFVESRFRRRTPTSRPVPT